MSAESLSMRNPTCIRTPSLTSHEYTGDRHTRDRDGVRPGATDEPPAEACDERRQQWQKRDGEQHLGIHARLTP